MSDKLLGAFIRKAHVTPILMLHFSRKSTLSKLFKKGATLARLISLAIRRVSFFCYTNQHQQIRSRISVLSTR